MTRYFFYIRSGSELTQDGEGEEFPNVEDAITEAQSAARELAIEELRSGKPVNGRSIELTNESGDVLRTISVRDVANGIQ